MDIYRLSPYLELTGRVSVSLRRSMCKALTCELELNRHSVAPTRSHGNEKARMSDLILELRFRPHKFKFNSTPHDVGTQSEGPKPATREGVNGSRSKFLPKFKPSAYIPKSPKPSSILAKVWNSYGKAKPTQKGLERASETSKQIGSESGKLQN